jgi:hypothetical protein
VAGLSAHDVASFIKVLDFIAVNVIPSKQRDARLFVPKRSGGNTGRELRSPARRR